MQIGRTKKLMTGGRVMLGVVIAKISISWLPIDKQFVLEGPILDQIKTHVDGFRPFLFYGGFGKTGSS